MPRLVLQSASLWRGTLTGCNQLLTLLMGNTSSLDLQTIRFESGRDNRRASDLECTSGDWSLQSASLWRGTLTLCGQLLTLQWAEYHFGILRQYDSNLESETGSAVGEPLEGHTRIVCGQLLILPMGGISPLDLVTIPFEWNAETGSAVGKPLKGHTGSVWSVAYSPNDGRYIISGSIDKTIRIWNTETQSASLWRGTLAWCRQLLTLLMGGTSSLDLMTRPFDLECRPSSAVASL
jgi:WD40 repeat protein